MPQRTPTGWASISDKSFEKSSPRENLQRLRDHGFTHLHFSSFWRSLELMTQEQLEEIQADLEATGMAVLDVHGCHTSDANLWSENPEHRNLALKLFKHRLEVTHFLGGDAMVYHVPCHVEPTPVVIDLFIDGLARMEDTARSLGIKVALENHYDAENDKVAITKAFERFDAEYIAFTFDPGHANMSGNLDWILGNCMDRLYILHLNDNDGIQDRHWLPGQQGGTVPWEKIIPAIAQSPYEKPIQLEVKRDEKAYSDQEEFLQAAARSLARIEAEVLAIRDKKTRLG